MGWAPGWGRRCDGVRRPGQDSGAQQRTGIDTVIAGGRTELIKDAALLRFGAALIPRAESRGQVVNAPSLHASGLPFEKNRFEATIHSSRRILLRQFGMLTVLRAAANVAATSARRTRPDDSSLP